MKRLIMESSLRVYQNGSEFQVLAFKEIGKERERQRELYLTGLGTGLVYEMEQWRNVRGSQLFPETTLPNMFLQTQGNSVWGVELLLHLKQKLPMFPQQSTIWYNQMGSIDIPHQKCQMTATIRCQRMCHKGDQLLFHQRRRFSIT